MKIMLEHAILPEHHGQNFMLTVQRGEKDDMSLYIYDRRNRPYDPVISFGLIRRSERVFCQDTRQSVRQSVRGSGVETLVEYLKNIFDFSKGKVDFIMSEKAIDQLDEEDREDALKQAAQTQTQEVEQ
jgi:hypothetical protein